MKTYFYSYSRDDYDLTPTIFQEDEYITRISFTPYQGNEYKKRETEEIKKCISQIFEYLDKKRTAFDIKYRLKDYSNFGQKVIDIVSAIPYGSYMYYSEVAKSAGSERAARAVGTVMAKNELPIIIPCHRVIRASHEIGNYEGGTKLKKRLLKLEGFYK